MSISHRLIGTAVAVVCGLTLVTGAAAQTPLEPNRTVMGSLDASDVRMADGDRMDCYIFNAPAGRYRINLESSAFHPFLLAGPGTGCATESRHASAGQDGRSAELRITVQSGPWFVRIAPARVGQLGAYQLRLTSLDSASAPATPSGLALSRNQACGYRPGSGTLTALLLYRNATTFEPSDHIQVDGRAVHWDQSGFVDAAHEPWFRDSSEIQFGGRAYRKYGLPRVLAPSEVTVVGEYRGQGILKDAGATDTPVIYLIENGLGCRFQPYVR